MLLYIETMIIESPIWLSQIGILNLQPTALRGYIYTYSYTILISERACGKQYFMVILVSNLNTNYISYRPPFENTKNITSALGIHISEVGIFVIKRS